jgi:hypothetical protein
VTKHDDWNAAGPQIVNEWTASTQQDSGRMSLASQFGCQIADVDLGSANRVCSSHQKGDLHCISS